MHQKKLDNFSACAIAATNDYRLEYQTGNQIAFKPIEQGCAQYPLLHSSDSTLTQRKMLIYFFQKRRTTFDNRVDTG